MVLRTNGQRRGVSMNAERRRACAEMYRGAFERSEALRSPAPAPRTRPKLQHNGVLRGGAHARARRRAHRTCPPRPTSVQVVQVFDSSTRRKETALGEHGNGVRFRLTSHWNEISISGSFPDWNMRHISDPHFSPFLASRAAPSTPGRSRISRISSAAVRPFHSGLGFRRGALEPKSIGCGYLEVPPEQRGDGDVARPDGQARRRGDVAHPPP